jgi:hypothetical protein
MMMPAEPAPGQQDRPNAATAFKRFEDAMRNIVRVSKKELDERIAARRTKRAARKPA